MDRLQKIAYVTGITIAITVFVAFVIMAFAPYLSNMVEDWKRTFVLSDVEYYEKFQNHPAYLAFYEKYPDATELFLPEKGGASLYVSIEDSTPYGKLELRMIYNTYYDDLSVEVLCDTVDDNLYPTYAHGSSIFAYIENSKCLEEPIEKIN